MNISRSFIALLLMTAFTTACVSETPATAKSDADATQLVCELGTVDKDLVFTPLHDGDDAELVLGFQGFMLVITRVRAKTGELPVTPKVRMTVERDGGAPSISTMVRAGTSHDSEGRAVSESLEMWLVPPDVSMFIGRKGSLEVLLQGRARSCVAKVDVRFVDDELCKHSEDGHVVCADGKTKGH